MSASFDTLDYLRKMHADTLGERAVHYLGQALRSGPATAGRVARLAMAAVQARLPEVHGSVADWVDESPTLYEVELCKAHDRGHINIHQANELRRAFASCFQPDERLRLICALRTSIARADARKSLDKIENLDVLKRRLAQGLNPAGDQLAA